MNKNNKRSFIMQRRLSFYDCKRFIFHKVTRNTGVPEVQLWPVIKCSIRNNLIKVNIYKYLLPEYYDIIKIINLQHRIRFNG
ncbi:hypothetical protein A3860_08595 [Niastella vici]|uniref:Uncharacterized protein n=1 Tax=Niastella vici TaxID=1703345 RepID=A0A1V9FH68_9BACT|nr:hypothetical protein A3860_08595 [Niastella vici]